MPLHPDAQSFLDKMANTSQPYEIPLHEFRDAAKAVIPTGPRLDIGLVDDLVIPGGDRQDLAIRCYQPEGSGPFPTLVWAHGGSFVRGTLDMFDAGRRGFVKATGVAIVAVDQRLSPEATYPQPLNDVLAAVAWTHENASRIRADPRLIGIAGESSGGNLAAAAALVDRDRGTARLTWQVLIEPILDYSCSSPSMHEFATGYLLTREQLVWAYQQYAPAADSTDPYVSPLRARRLDGLPPAVIVTIEFDPSRDEGEEYVRRLRAAAVPVQHARIDGMVHHFPGPELIPTAARLVVDLLRSGLS
jgi:acetyl esterase